MLVEALLLVYLHIDRCCRGEKRSGTGGKRGFDFWWEGGLEVERETFKTSDTKKNGLHW